jgi:hypothetical protein
MANRLLDPVCHAQYTGYNGNEASLYLSCCLSSLICLQQLWLPNSLRGIETIVETDVAVGSMTSSPLLRTLSRTPSFVILSCILGQQARGEDLHGSSPSLSARCDDYLYMYTVLLPHPLLASTVAYGFTFTFTFRLVSLFRFGLCTLCFLVSNSFLSLCM